MKKQAAEAYNSQPGDLTGYDCPKCLNRGNFEVVEDDGRVRIVFCECRDIRQSRRNIERSGLSKAVDAWTFDTFTSEQDWQKGIKSDALRYADALRDGTDAWFFLSGQPGCGKTHLCTAICGAALQSGIHVRYMLWMDESSKIKALRNDDEAMEAMLEPLKSVGLLYIDDLFKTVNHGTAASRPTPTEADVKLCFEILNARYMRKKPTIISCEWTLTGDLLDVDEGTFSRVYQAAKGFTCQIGRDRAKNYRLRGA